MEQIHLTNAIPPSIFDQCEPRLSVERSQTSVVSCVARGTRSNVLFVGGGQQRPVIHSFNMERTTTTTTNGANRVGGYCFGSFIHPFVRVSVSFLFARPPAYQSTGVASWMPVSGSEFELFQGDGGGRSMSTVICTPHQFDRRTELTRRHFWPRCCRRAAVSVVVVVVALCIV